MVNVTPERRIELLLWRHAEAEDGGDDLKRALTARGQKQAKNVAAWIRAHTPEDLRIVCSPAIRTRQTADALGLPYKVVRKTAPGASPSDLLTAVGWPYDNNCQAALIVGHQPTLGQLASLLVTGGEAAWAIKKGALWWLSHRVRGGQSETVLRAVIPPEFAK